MCSCGTPTINGQSGYRWQPNDTPSIRPLNPPELSDGETLVRDEPGRCGGLDSHCHHYCLTMRHANYYLLVRHGGGDERIPLFKPEVDAIKGLDSTSCYWIMGAIYHANAEGKRNARQAADLQWRTAAAEKRIKTRKLRGAEGVKVWIVSRSLDVTANATKQI